MVLNVQDEIINGTPKYNITSNGDGTSNIELANEIVSEGTNLNRALFNKIENVLSYQVPTATKNVISETEYTYNNINISSIENGIAKSSIRNKLVYNYQTLGNIFAPIIKWYAEGQNIRLDNAENAGYTCIAYRRSSSWNWTESDWIEFENRTSSNSNYYNSINAATTKVYKEYDFIFPSKIKMSFLAQFSNHSCYIQGSNDGIVWTTLETMISDDYGRYIPTVFESQEYYRFYRLEFERSSTYTSAMYIMLYFSRITELNVIVGNYQYDFVLDNNTSTFINNQRVLINTSNDLDNSGVISEKLNNKELDSILEANKYYELVYNSSQNKFIAQEVRN